MTARLILPPLSLTLSPPPHLYPFFFLLIHSLLAWRCSVSIDAELKVSVSLTAFLLSCIMDQARVWKSLCVYVCEWETS